MTNAKAILLLSFSDKKGLLATISHFIFPFQTENRIPVRGIKTVYFT